MSEWQPARTRLVHNFTGFENYVGNENNLAASGRVIRVREFFGSISPISLEALRQVGCDSKKFYEVHPDDQIPDCGVVICEHEILTD
jgi:hypothetical protein